METVQIKTAVEVKQIGAANDRVLRFIASTENPDRDKDIIISSGWKYDNYNKNPVVLWMHDHTQIIGRAIFIQIDKRNKQLLIDVKFPSIEEMTTNGAEPSDHALFIDTIYNLYKNKYLNAVSVGFRSITAKRRDDPIALALPEWDRGNLFLEQELFELSLVTVPANAEALQTDKSFSKKGLRIYNEFLETKKQEANELSRDEVIELIKETYKSIVSDQQKSFTVEKAGARISKETAKELQEAMDHMINASDYIQKCNTKIKGLMDGVTEPMTDNSTGAEVAKPEETGKSILDSIDTEKLVNK